MKYRKIVSSTMQSYYAINEETGFTQMIEKRVFARENGAEEVEGWLLETYKENFHSTYLLGNGAKSSKKEWDEAKKALNSYIKERV